MVKVDLMPFEILQGDQTMKVCVAGILKINEYPVT